MFEFNSAAGSAEFKQASSTMFIRKTKCTEDLTGMLLEKSDCSVVFIAHANLFFKRGLLPRKYLPSRIQPVLR